MESGDRQPLHVIAIGHGRDVEWLKKPEPQL
jgi:hypothetical protein